MTPREWLENPDVFGKSLKADSIRRECEASLRRLKVECIDLYQIHWPDPDADVEQGWETMTRLKEEGKARWIGVSNFSVSQMQRAAAIAPVTSLNAIIASSRFFLPLISINCAVVPCAVTRPWEMMMISSQSAATSCMT